VKPPTWGLTYWPIFLIAGSAWFIIGESLALATNAKNTLSDYSWYELHIQPGITQHTVAWYFSLIAWVLFAVLITGHIWLRNPS
jgi:hypothetical protein